MVQCCRGGNHTLKAAKGADMPAAHCTKSSHSPDHPKECRGAAVLTPAGVGDSHKFSLRMLGGAADDRLHSSSAQVQACTPAGFCSRQLPHLDAGDGVQALLCQLRGGVLAEHRARELLARGPCLQLQGFELAHTAQHIPHLGTSSSWGQSCIDT